MPDDSYRAPPRKTVGEIRHVAEQLAAALEYSDQALFPIMNSIERDLDQDWNLLRLEMWSPEVMGTREGLSFVEDGVSRIVLAEQIYAAACKGQWRARRIAAHELGHWALHSNLWTRMPNRPDAAPTAANDGLIEDEAEIFSIELLMPLRHIRLNDTALDVAQRFQAPRALAENRLMAARKVGAQQKRTADRGSAALERLVTG